MALGSAFYNGAFSPAVRKSPIDNTDFELNDAYKPTGSTTQPERSLSGGATASDPGAGANSVYGPTAPHETSSGLVTTHQPDIIKDVYAPHLQEVSQKLQDAYSAPRPGAARQIFGAILSRRNPQLGGLVSGETQRQQRIQPLQQEVGLIGGQIQAARTQQNQEVENEYKRAQTNYANKHADVIENPPIKPTPEEQAVQTYIKQGMDPAQAYTKVKQDIQDTKPDKAPPKPSEEDKALTDYLQGHKMADTPANRDRARSVLKTRDRPAKDPDLADIKKQIAEEQLRKMQEPTGKEKDRADLARNLNENLDTLEEIVNRRPELFGPFAGRLTEGKMFVGSDDADIGALQNIKHQAGMAQNSAHGMRSAHGVDAAAQALMNIHNEPNAIRGAIKSARNSVKTFQEDAENTSNRISGNAPAATSAPASGVPSFSDWKKSQH